MNQKRHSGKPAPGSPEPRREGSLESPTRHPIPWQSADYYDERSLRQELDRVFDICHGCRRCVNLCKAFPTLFDLIDNSETMEPDGMTAEDHGQVVKQCYLCDLCYMTKCPYVPPHPWNLDFPQLMLRAKACDFRAGRARWRDRLLTSVWLHRLCGLPGIAPLLNFFSAGGGLLRRMLEWFAGIHRHARLPRFFSGGQRRRKARCRAQHSPGAAETGRVALFTTCYGERNEPAWVQDLIRVLEHNGVHVRTLAVERCCGMPRLELGDLQAVRRLKERNLPEMAALAEEGWTLTAPIPSCVLMFKQQLPLLFPGDTQLEKVSRAFRDPWEYLAALHKAGKLRTDFQRGLGRVVYHAPCHQRVQNIGPKTQEVLELVPNTQLTVVARCSGHNGSYALKRECYANARSICRPVVRKVEEQRADHYLSDCPLAGRHIQEGLADRREPSNAFALLRQAYGI